MFDAKTRVKRPTAKRRNVARMAINGFGMMQPVWRWQGREVVYWRKARYACAGVSPGRGVGPAVAMRCSSAKRRETVRVALVITLPLRVAMCGR